MTLRTTEHGIDLIKAFEKYAKVPYKCPAGKWTAGYGHTIEAGPPLVTVNGPVLTEPEALAVLRSDIDGFENSIEGLTKGVVLTDYQFDALVSFTFNAGVPNFKSSTLLKKVLANDMTGAALQFARWNKFHNPKTGEVEDSPGLTRRRRAEAALFQGDLVDTQSYMGMDFGPMPQEVVQPPPPKPMSQSKVGNTSLVSTVGAVALGAKAMISAAQPTVDTVQAVTAQAQAVTGQVQSSVQQAQTTVQTTQTVVHTVHTLVPHLALANAAPWAALTLLVITGFAYVYYDRHKKLTQEGV